MSLVVLCEQQTIFNNTKQSQDCKTIEVLDTTGAYNVSTNPTGYGSPNNAANTSVKVYALVLQPNTTAYTTCLFDSTTTPTNDQIVQATENMPINTFVLGETTATNLGQLPDGAWNLWYIPMWDNSLSISGLVQGETGFTGTGLTSAPHAGITHMEIDGVLYEVTITSATTGVLGKVFESPDGTYSVLEGFGANIELQAFCVGDSCLDRKNGELAAQNCGCNSEKMNEFLKFRAIQNGAKALFNCGAYSNCNKAINQVTNYCNGDDCGCN